MTQAAHRGPFAFLSSVMNSDGRAHPVENAFAGITLLLGAVAVMTSLWPGLHLLSAWAGLAGVLAGGWGQMISATTAERFVLVIGMGAAGLGMYLGLAHGGLFG